MRALLLVTCGLLLQQAHVNGQPTPCSIQESLKIPDARLVKNGSLIDPESEMVYPKGYYFQVNGVYRGCICKLKPCIRKCCERDEYLNRSSTNCFKSENLTREDIDNLFSPFIFDLPTLEPKQKSESAYKHFGVLHEKICEGSKYQLEPEEFPTTDQYFLLANGSLYMPGMDQKILSVNEYCMEHLESAALVVLLCFPDENIAAKVAFTMYPVGMCLSIVFLIITLVVYALLPDLRNLHGILLMYHVCSLLVAYFTLVIVQTASNQLYEFAPWLCITAAFVVEFTFAAAFFWLNVMCFDICWMFSGMTSHRGTPDRERRKLIIYSLYAWGCPLVMLLVSVIMEYAPGIPDTVLKPEFGVQRCWFGGKLAVFAYFFGPISVLLICNLVLFIMTAVRIVKLRRGTAVLKHADSQRSGDQREKQQKFILYLKLFVVMGLTWIMELVSWTIGGSTYLWILTDVCNTLQGLCIFLIFVWKPKVRRLLIARLRGKKRPSSGVQSDGMRGAALSRLSKPDHASYSDSSTRHQSSITQTTSLIAESMPDVAKCAVTDTDNE